MGDVSVMYAMCFLCRLQLCSRPTDRTKRPRASLAGEDEASDLRHLIARYVHLKGGRTDGRTDVSSTDKVFRWTGRSVGRGVPLDGAFRWTGHTCRRTVQIRTVDTTESTSSLGSHAPTRGVRPLY